MSGLAQGIFEFSKLTETKPAEQRSVSHAHERAKRLIADLAATYRATLARKFAERDAEMQGDDTSHHLLYRALGVTAEEGRLIDAYQNKGRFLYTNAGGFLEEAARISFSTAFPDARRMMVPNATARRPKEFEIDCLIGTDAVEIKWRDATTDGDHIAKEEARVKSIHAAGLTPVRVMFYAPNRAQARDVQAKLRAVYHQIGGLYFMGPDAFDFVHVKTGIDLKAILDEIARAEDQELAAA